MPQFSGLIVKGVIGAVADGNVLITRPAMDGKPASTIRGERLDYNGKPGMIDYLNWFGRTVSASRIAPYC